MGVFLFIFANVFSIFLLLRDRMRMAKLAILAWSEHRWQSTHLARNRSGWQGRPVFVANQWLINASLHSLQLFLQL